MDYQTFLKNFQIKPVIIHQDIPDQKPLASICILTYQHVNYIKQCLDGILMQQTTFPIEILLGEDASSDGTREICLEYAANHPDKIRLFLHHRENNIAINGNPTGRFNFLYNLYNARGNYIALCEGDDYWTDPLKLQKQVDFLEGNPDYKICFHNVKIYNHEKGSFEKDTITRVVPETTTLKELAKGNFIHTPSVVIRNDFRIPKWFNKVILGDWSLYMLAIKGKKLFKFGDEMAVYRMHDQSIWSKLDQEKRNKLTNENVELLLKNLKMNRESKNILRNRLGLKNKTAFFKKLFNKLKQKTSKFA
jgi:glycosyltransferase involved in cell wall biosynthesis